MQSSETNIAPDWKLDPKDFLVSLCGPNKLPRGSAGMAILHAGIAGPIREYLAAPELVDPLLALLVILEDQTSYSRGSQSFEFVKHGPALFPSSPDGIRALAMVRDECRAKMRGNLNCMRVEEDSDFAKVARALESVPSKVFLQSTVNGSNSDSIGSSLALDLRLDSVIMGAMPKGSAPESLLIPQLEGLEVSGNIVEEWRESAGACLAGTIEFLNTIKVSFEQEGGDFDCDQCGSRIESEEERLLWVEDFTITRAHVRLLEGAGFADSFRDWLVDNSDSCGDLEAFLEETDSALLERFAPSSKEGEGMRYSTAYWEFEPDFSSVEGLEELPDSDMIRTVSILQRIAIAFESAGQLPPIEGTLTIRNREGVSFGWKPEEGTLVYRAPSIRIVRALQSGTMAVEFEGRKYTLDDRARLTMAHDSAGANTSRLVRMAKGSVIV